MAGGYEFSNREARKLPSCAARAFVIGCGLVAFAVRQADCQAELRGRVLTDSSRRPVAGARVNSLTAKRPPVIADSAGRFVLSGLQAGSHVIVTQAIGFRPDSTLMDFAPSETVVQDVTLRPQVNQLEEVRVAAAATRYVTGKMVGFEERRSQGIGQFIERATLEKYRTRRTSDILASTGKGVDVRRGRSKAWAVSGRATSSGKCAFCRDRPLEVLDPADLAAGAIPACYMDVWLDGTLVYDSASRRAALFDLNSIDPDNIEAIEIYTGASQLPAKFNRTGGGCGAMVIWTRI